MTEVVINSNINRISAWYHTRPVIKDETIEKPWFKDYNEVFEVMQKYSEKKGYNLSKSELYTMAENMFLTFEAKKWSGCKYWPPLAMRWVLNNKPKYTRPVVTKSRQGKSVRDKILEQRGKDEF